MGRDLLPPLRGQLTRNAYSRPRSQGVVTLTAPHSARGRAPSVGAPYISGDYRGSIATPDNDFIRCPASARDGSTGSNRPSLVTPPARSSSMAPAAGSGTGALRPSSSSGGAPGVIDATGNALDKSDKARSASERKVMAVVPTPSRSRSRPAPSSSVAPASSTPEGAPPVVTTSNAAVNNTAGCGDSGAAPGALGNAKDVAPWPPPQPSPLPNPRRTSLSRERPTETCSGGALRPLSSSGPGTVRKTASDPTPVPSLLQTAQAYAKAKAPRPPSTQNPGTSRPSNLAAPGLRQTSAIRGNSTGSAGPRRDIDQETSVPAQLFDRMMRLGQAAKRRGQHVLNSDGILELHR